MKRLKDLFRIFFAFLKIGAFTFGGGYAMIAILENDIVTERQWLQKDEFLDIVAIAESTPGPIAINMATYIGYKREGVLGSVFATLGVCLPSFTIIYLISLFFERFLAFKPVAMAFRGVQVCVVYLIARAGWKMFKGIKKSVLNYILFGAVAVAFLTLYLFGKTFSSVFYILICGTVGLVAYLIARIKKGGAGR